MCTKHLLFSTQINGTSTNGVSSTNGHASKAAVSDISHLVRKKVREREVLFFFLTEWGEMNCTDLAMLHNTHLNKSVYFRGNQRRVQWRRVWSRRWSRVPVTLMECRSLRLTETLTDTLKCRSREVRVDFKKQTTWTTNHDFDYLVQVWFVSDSNSSFSQRGCRTPPPMFRLHLRRVANMPSSHCCHTCLLL